jgi:hypothetical protein
MTRIRWLASFGAAVVALGLLVAVAQQGGSYEFVRHGIPGGGGRSTMDAYELEGAIGQPFAGKVQGSGFVLDGGIFGGGGAEVGPAIKKLYAPALSSQP